MVNWSEIRRLKRVEKQDVLQIENGPPKSVSCLLIVFLTNMGSLLLLQAKSFD